MKLVTTKGKKGGESLKYKTGSLPIGSSSTCSQCQHVNVQITGPMWIDPLFDSEVLKQLMDHLTENKDSYNSYSRLFGFLTTMSTELHEPLLYSVSRLSKILHCNVPPITQFKAAFLNAGYEISSSHTDANSIKTNAPNDFIWDVFRAWIKLNPIKTPNENSPAFRLLSVEQKHQIDFTIPEGKESEIGCAKLKRKHKKDFVPTFLPAPTANWGPKARATGFKRTQREGDEMQIEPESKKQKIDNDTPKE